MNSIHTDIRMYDLSDSLKSQYNVLHSGELSVVVPVYNREQLVVRMLESLECQERLPNEVILVDNNSTDNTLNVLNEWRDRMALEHPKMHVLVIQEKGKGASQARQTGLNTVQGEYVMFFDSDDTMRPGHIKRIYDMMGDCEIMAWPTLLHYLDGRRKRTPLLKGKIMENNQLHALLCTAGYAVKTELIKSVGGWDVTLGGWDDIELSHRILLTKPRVKVDKRVMVDVYAQGEGSITGTSYTQREGEWENVINIMEDETSHADALTSEEKLQILRLLAYRRTILGALYAREGNHRASKDCKEKGINSKWVSNNLKFYYRLAYFLTSKGIPGTARLIPYLI